VADAEPAAEGGGPVSAAQLVGSDDDHLFLAEDETVLPAPTAAVWDLLEGDHQVRFLEALAPRTFLGRDVLEVLPDGYRCRTTSRVRFGRRRSFESVVLLDRPARSVEVQLGERTDLRYVTRYEPVDGGTRLHVEQSFRAKRASFESAAVVGALHQRAVGVIAERLAAARRLVEGS